MTLCLFAAGKVTAYAATAFTLGWTHSVEKTRWEEDWHLLDDGRLTVVEARVQGSGAGMEPPEGAVLRGGWWVYTPSLPPQANLSLAASGATGGGWTVCFGDECIEVGTTPGAPVQLRACKPDRT